MDARKKRMLGAVVASVLLGFVALASGIVPIGAPEKSPGAGPVSAEASNNFDQLVVVLMENHDLPDIYGPAPYMTQLADQYALSQHWASLTNPSQPNYIGLIGGSLFGVSGDGNHPNLNHPTIVDIMENTGKTWKAFAEDAGGSGCGLSPPRGEDHFPFLSYTTITGNSARCANLLPGSSNEVISAFNAGTNFIWLTPNDCNNMHSCSVSVGDNYIHGWVPTLLSAMSGKKAALILMYDEGYRSPPLIYMGFSGTAAKTAYKSTVAYNHYSFIKLLEDVWGGGNLGQGDVNAPSPVEFFLAGGPDFGIAASPTSVSFGSGGSATSTVSLTASGGFTGTVGLTAVSAPSGVTTTCVPSSISGSQTSTCTLSATNAGSYTVTITGTSGTLVHTATVAATVTSPDFSLAANPASVSFAGGQSAPSTISFQPSGGFTGTVALTAASVPAGVTTTCAPTSISGSQTSTCTLSATNAGSYTVTITGTSGTLLHTTPIATTVTAPGPIARFTFSPSYPKVNGSITFDSSSSSDSDPTATLQARWDWEGDGVWDTSLSSTLTAQHAFGTVGTYAVTLQIQDSHALTNIVSHAVSVTTLGGAGAGAPPGFGLLDPSVLQAHGPIYIGSNADFTSANGVRSGTGTIADPYIISNWFIDGNLYSTTQVMFWIESTNAYAVVQNVRIANLVGTNQWEAFQVGHWPAILTTQHVTFRHNAVENAQHAYGFGIREGSTDILVEANYVQLDANFEWVYGIETDRNVHGVTITGNYVNAHTSGIFHTGGIQLGDVHVTDARRTTGVVATHNTVVNATASGIFAESSVGTFIGWNLVYQDYPGTKSAGTDWARGIMIESYANGTIIVGNVIHTIHWGIQVGSDQAIVASNTITAADYGVYVLDPAQWPGVSTVGDTIFDTTYSSVANAGIRIPANFQGTVVDVGPGSRTADLTPVTFVTSTAATRIAFAWSGRNLNLSAMVGGFLVFDSGTTTDSQTLQAAWTGSVGSLRATGLSQANVGFQLTSSAAAAFDGSGFTPSTTYNLTRGGSQILSAQSTSNGVISMTIPASVPSTYALSPGSVSDTIAPVSTCLVSGTAGANSWYTSSVSVSLSATDDRSGVAAIHFLIDGSAWQTYTGAVVVQGEGTHTVGYYATDIAGNNEATRTVSANIDTSKPVTSAQVRGTPAPDGSYVGSANITLTATDVGSGVQAVQYRLDGGAWRPYTTTFLLSGNGQHTIDYTATDVAGNVEAAQSSIVRISRSLSSPPVTTLNLAGTLGANGWYISSVAVTLQATSPSGGTISIAYSIDGGAWATYSATFTLPEGRHTVTYQSLDSAGYVEAMRSTEIGIDLTNPVVGVSSPIGSVTNPAVTIAWTGSDSASGIARYELSTDGGPFLSVGMNTSVVRQMSNGAHKAQVRAIDNAGHESTTETDFRVESSGVVFPGLLQAIPLYFPAMALMLLLVSALMLRRRRRRRERPERYSDEEYEAEDDTSDL